jgi:hypothetical protein
MLKIYHKNYYLMNNINILLAISLQIVKIFRFDISFYE